MKEDPVERDNTAQYINNTADHPTLSYSNIVSLSLFNFSLNMLLGTKSWFASSDKKRASRLLYSL